MTGLFTTLAQLLDLDDDQARALWQTVCQSRFSVPTAWRNQLVDFDNMPMPLQMRKEAVLPFLQAHMPPARLVEVFEALHLEGLMTRAEATALSERLFEITDAQGQWFWQWLGPLRTQEGAHHE